MPRLNLNLSDRAYRQLQELAEASNTTMTEVVKTGLGLARITQEESKKRNSLAITNRHGKVIKQLVVPQLTDDSE